MGLDQLGLRVAVLTPQKALIAVFSSSIEACRYAALISEPGYEPVLRRTSDGAEMRFNPATSSAAILAWAETERGFAPSPPATGRRTA